MAKTYYEPWQNPTYPQDQDITEDEKEALARTASMARAQSPQPLVCQIDGTWSVDDPFHADPFKVCMDFRHEHVVGDNEPWTFWQEIDGPLVPPKQPLPPLPAGIRDWQVRAFAGALPPGASLPPIPPPDTGVTRVWQTLAQVVTDATGAPQMDGIDAGWNGFTFVLNIDPSVIAPLSPLPYALRVTLVGSFTIFTLWISGAEPLNTWLALNAEMFPMTFGGNFTATATMNADGTFNPLVSDQLDVSIDLTNGLWLTGFFTADSDGLVGSRTYDPGWMTLYAQDNVAAQPDENGNIDFSTYTIDTINNVIAVLKVEGLFDPVIP